MSRYRNIIYTLSITAVAVFAVSFLPHNLFRYEFSQREFYESKIKEYPVYNIVIAGDSRTLAALSPDKMLKSHSLRKYKILNFAFTGAAFTQRYLDAIESKLSEKAEKKIIMLGASGLSFCGTGGYVDRLLQNQERSENKSLKDLFGIQLDIKLPKFFNPIHPIRLISRLKGTPLNIEKTYMPDKSLAVTNVSKRFSEVLKKKTFASYDNLALNHDLLENLLKQVSDWSGRGILVVGFYPPINEVILDLEKEHLKYDIGEFATRFTNAGGKWIEVDSSRYKTFDNSHLDYTNSKAFSAYISKELSKIIQRYTEGTN